MRKSRVHKNQWIDMEYVTRFDYLDCFSNVQYINDVYLQGVINMIVKIMIKLLSTNCKALVSFWILVNQTSFLNKMQQSLRNGQVFCGKKCIYISSTNWNDVLEVFLKTVYAKSKLQLNKYFQVGIIMFWTDQWHWCGKHPLVSWKVFFS